MCVSQKGRKDIAVSLSPEVYCDATAIAYRYHDTIHHHILSDHLCIFRNCGLGQSQHASLQRHSRRFKCNAVPLSLYTTSSVRASAAWNCAPDTLIPAPLSKKGVHIFRLRTQEGESMQIMAQHAGHAIKGGWPDSKGGSRCREIPFVLCGMASLLGSRALFVGTHAAFAT